MFKSKAIPFAVTEDLSLSLDSKPRKACARPPGRNAIIRFVVLVWIRYRSESWEPLSSEIPLLERIEAEDPG